MRCAECGGEMVLVSTPLTEKLRGEAYTLCGIPRYECTACGEYEITAADEHRLSAELWARYRERHGILSPQEIVVLRSSLGLTQAEFGKIVEANVQTVSRWENGRVIPDARANKLMTLLRDIPAARAALYEMAEIRTGWTVALSTGVVSPVVPFTVEGMEQTVRVGNSKAARSIPGGSFLDLGKAVAQ